MEYDKRDQFKKNLNEKKIATKSGINAVSGGFANQSTKAPNRPKKLIVLGLIGFIIGAVFVISGHVINPDDRLLSFWNKNGETFTSEVSSEKLFENPVVGNILKLEAPEMVRTHETIKDQKNKAKYFWMAGYPITILGVVFILIGFARKKSC